MAGKEKIGLAIAGTSFLFIFLFARLVWPTKYRYFEVKGENVTMPVRVNRLTGETCIFILQRMDWVKRVLELQKPKQEPKQAAAPPPPPGFVVDPLELNKTPDELTFERAKKALQEEAAAAAPQYVVVPCGK